MKKNLIKVSFFILLTSCLSKILSFFVRITLARVLSTEAMNLYSLALPTLNLLITLSQMGIPTAMAKLIAAKEHYHTTILASILLSILNNFFLILTFILLIPFLSQVLFSTSSHQAVLYAVLPMIPLVTLSGLCKGALMGRKEILSYSCGQVSEEFFRVLFLLITIPYCVNPSTLAQLALASLSVGELASAIHMGILLFLKRKPALPSNKPTITKMSKKILSVSIPMTLSRLIGSLTAFLEPMILLSCSSSSINQLLVREFTSLNSFVMPIITLPTFLIIMISNWVLPAFSEAFSKKEEQTMLSLFYQSCGCSFLLSGLYSCILLLFPNQICQLLYHQTHHAQLLRTLALPFAFYGLQPVLSALLHASNNSKKALFDTTLGCLIRVSTIYFITPYLGTKTIALALCLSMLTTTFLHLFHTLKLLFFHHI